MSDGKFAEATLRGLARGVGPRNMSVYMHNALSVRSSGCALKARDILGSDMWFQFCREVRERSALYQCWGCRRATFLSWVRQWCHLCDPHQLFVNDIDHDGDLIT